MTSLRGGSGLDALRGALLRWYDRHRRPLPWRQTSDPYGIWVAEVMLQQTTVRAVEPRWRRFLERFPDIRALARAPLEDVLAEWSGLGYYSRARNLHAAAQRVAGDFGGVIPRKPEELLALPGMGRYTAAAVASIAFGAPAAVLDANVERVIARLDCLEEDIKSTRLRKRLWSRAQELLEPARPGDWNQAMMELGAVVCLPRAPQCGVCPLAPHCAALRTGEPERIPVVRAKPPMRAAEEVAVVLRRRGRVLILQRPGEGSFGGMWELPRGEIRDGETQAAAAARIVRELTGIEARPLRGILRLAHVVMRRKIALHVWEVEAACARVRRSMHAAHRWELPEAWAPLPASTTQREIAAYLATGRVPSHRHGPATGDQDEPLFATEDGAAFPG
ncbi:A/G-specific adenine glycosylase [Candidatus Poribacteria bacterium]|nr:A/G-specific adenine glycosylase [Candidatus Poribacteria bacterium]